jgi:uncharacterized protein YdiU (UPF0061 family)
MAPMRLDQVRFESRFVRALPGDPETANRPREVRGACWSAVQPTPVRAPRLLAWSDDLGAELGLARPDAPDGPEAQILGGNRLAEGMRPYAARYGGWQFGTWAGQLGDGRAVLRSSLREFLCSEAMHHLGVPTTRALALVGSGEDVVRDMFYDGRPEHEPGALVCRVAPTFIRPGNFEILAASGETELLRTLADDVLREHYPELGPGATADFFAELARRTARLVADWMRLGFVHGVMNTDNLSILGLTIDYGPYGWLDSVDFLWTPNTTDAQSRRYAYGRQPEVAMWNLARFAEALVPLTGGSAPLERGLEAYRETFERTWTSSLAAKLGLLRLDRAGDGPWVNELLDLLQAAETDWTIFFRRLAEVEGPADFERLRPSFYDDRAPEERWRAWLGGYAGRLREEGRPAAERREAMRRVNPLYVPRNYLAQEAIDALAQGDAGPLERLVRVLRTPYDEQPGEEALAARRPDWARSRPGCSSLSCSS